MKKKLFSLFSSLITVISLAAMIPEIGANAGEFNNLYYRVIDSNCIEITGYNGTDTEIEIPSYIDELPVYSIGYGAFNDNYKLTNIVLPDTLQTIDDYAFCGCWNLKSIIIPNSVTEIDRCAFSDCYKLSTIKMPDFMWRIKDSTFSNCQSLESITIPNSVIDIDKYAFSSCSSLKSIVIPENVEAIGKSAFDNCTNLTNISISSSVIYIADDAFHNDTSLIDINVHKDNRKFSSENGVLLSKYKTELLQYPIGNPRTSYTVPNTVVCIAERAFENCNYIQKVVLPSSIMAIEEAAFYNCSHLNSLTIGTHLTNIGEHSFYGCNNLKSVMIPKKVVAIGNFSFGYFFDSTDWETKKIENFKINCYSETAGEKYAKSNGFEYTVLDAKPTNVSGFKAAATSNTKVKLTCNKVSGADGYIYYQYNSASKKWERISKSKSTVYLVQNLKPATTYTFAVKAYKTVDGKEITSEKYPTVTTTTTPQTVNFKLNAYPNKVTIGWNKTSGATGYVVYCKTSANGKWQRLKVTKGTSYTNTNLRKGRTYYFTVRAYKNLNGKNYYGSFTTKKITAK